MSSLGRSTSSLETTPVKEAPIHFYPFVVLYFFLYNLSPPDIIMYIDFLLSVFLTESSVREWTLLGSCYVVHLQHTEHIGLAHISYSENIYE